MISVNWCQYWDESANEPGGVMRCIGEACTPEEVKRLLDVGIGAALANDWGPGMIYASDDEGTRMDLRDLLDAREPVSLLRIASCLPPRRHMRESVYSWN